MRRRLSLLVAAVALLAVGARGPAFAAVKTYTVPVISDFSGAYAELFKAYVPVHKAVFAWWNDTVGKELGVELTPKHYDGRYDATVVASMWPAILAECNPVMGLGAGGPDVAALQQRLPKDKVPVFYGTAAYGYAWLPDQWLFHPRPTYLHELLGAFNWYIGQHPEKKPVKLGQLTANVTPAIDLQKGMEKYVTEVLEPKGLAKVVAKEFVDINPTDISSQVKKLIDAQSDIVVAPVTTAMTTAYVRACQLHGVNIPTIASPHHTIFPFGRAMKTYEPFEGHMVVAGHVAVTKTDTAGYKFFELLAQKYGLDKNGWNAFTIMAFNQALLAVRALEHAAKKVGGANLTGQAVYDAMFEGPFTQEELMGTLPTLAYTKEAPFPLGKDVKVMIETVKKGQYTVATDEWQPIPADLRKW